VIDVGLGAGGFEQSYSSDEKSLIAVRRGMSATTLRNRHVKVPMSARPFPSPVSNGQAINVIDTRSNKFRSGDVEHDRHRRIGTEPCACRCRSAKRRRPARFARRRNPSMARLLERGRLSLIVRRARESQRGSNPGFKAFAMGDRSRRRGFVLLTNGDNGLELAATAARVIMQRDYPWFRFYMLHPHD
jgi:hypothetical protein